MKGLNNKTIYGLVAKMLGKKSLTNNEGKVELTDDEKKRISAIYGAEFLSNLEASADDSDEEAVKIFEAMINASKQDRETIAQLRETVNALSAEPEQKPAAAAAVPAAPAAPKALINASAMHNRVAAAAFAAANPASVFATINSGSIDVTDLNAELGTVMPEGVKLQILSKRIYNGFDDAKYFTKHVSNTDYKSAAALMSEVSQQFTAAWTPKGTGKFTPCTIKYRRHKINVAIKPADILKSWLLYLYEQGKTQADMPIVRYLIEEHILPKVTDDITLAMLGKGKFVESVGAQDGDEGSAAADSMDGYETILVDNRASKTSKMNFFKNAADYRQMTEEQLIAYVESFVDAINPLFARHLELHCSPEFLTAYKRADFKVNGKYTGDESDGKIRFTAFSLIPLASMYNSPILFATPKENFVLLVDLANAANCINKIEEQNYDVKVFGEYSLSVGFLVEEAVYAAVPAGYNPKEAILNDGNHIGDAWEQGSGDDSSEASVETA